MSKEEREKKIVTLMMARKLYEDLAAHKGWEPWEFPYVDRGSMKIAKRAVDYLGYDDDLVDEIKKEVDVTDLMTDGWSK